MTLTPSDITAALASAGLTPSRALGQNFVADPNTVRRIARLADVGTGDHVVEIGAGLGSLTLALVETGAEVTAVEIDRHLVPMLRAQVESHGARVVEGDALALDWTPLLAASPSWVLVANLPYNVATPLVLDLLDHVPAIGRMLVMVQREVAERLAARPGTKAWGIPSVKVAFWADAAVIGTVPATVFVPRPKVESALVAITRHPPPDGADAARVFALVRAGFGHRRKTLRNTIGDQVTPEAFAEAGVDPGARAEQLEVADWVRLARVAGPEPDAP